MAERALKPVCTCLALLEADLVERALNTTVGCDLFTGAVQIATYKRDPKVRKKPVVMLASYCPICGKKYEPYRPKRAASNQPTEAAHG